MEQKGRRRLSASGWRAALLRFGQDDLTVDSWIEWGRVGSHRSSADGVKATAGLRGFRNTRPDRFAT